MSQKDQDSYNSKISMKKVIDDTCTYKNFIFSWTEGINAAND